MLSNAKLILRSRIADIHLELANSCHFTHKYFQAHNILVKARGKDCLQPTSISKSFCLSKIRVFPTFSLLVNILCKNFFFSYKLCSIYYIIYITVCELIIFYFSAIIFQDQKITRNTFQFKGKRNTKSKKNI